MEISDFSLEIETHVFRNLAEAGSRTQAFTLYVMNEMQEKANLGEVCCCYDKSVSSQRREGIINGYAISLGGDDGGYGKKLTLFGTIYKQLQDGVVEQLSAADFQRAATKVQNYYINATKGNYVDMPTHSDKYRLCEYISNHQDNIETVQFVIISNCIVPKCQTPAVKIDGKTISFVTWDICQLYNNIYSDSDRIEITVDFKDDNVFQKFRLPFVKMQAGDKNYDAYVGIVPGDFLHSLYEIHNIDLLQSNLRYFKGNTVINKGMFETIREEPYMFLAYNNGLTTIASDVTFESEDGTNGFITKLNGFQIVNGGQTTASLFTVKSQHPDIDLSNVFVQMKLIVVKEDIQEILPKITRFSNSQNKVPNSDFSSNSPFCLALDKLSKSIYAPDPFGTGNPTRWYFNKFSKQYNKELENLKEKDKKAAFQRLYPFNQVYDKIEVAKAFNSWNRLPYAVAKGGQYSFKVFVETYLGEKKKGGTITVDRMFYEDLIAQLILFSYLEKESLVFASFKDHRSLVIPFTISMLSILCSDNFSLLKIWKQQRLPDELKDFLDDLGKQIYAKMKAKVPDGQSFRTYCGVVKNWESLKTESFDLSKFSSLLDCMKDANEDNERIESSKCSVSNEDREKVLSFGAKFWAGLSTYYDKFGTGARDKMSAIVNSISSNRIPDDELIAKALDYIKTFEEMGVSLDEVKSKTTISDKVADISIVSKQARIRKIPLSDYDVILTLASKTADQGEMVIMKSFFSAINKKNISIERCNIICEILDRINKKFGQKY